MPAVERRVVGLGDHAAHAVDGRERLRHLREVAVVGEGGVAALDAAPHEGRAVDAREHHVVAADVHVVGVVARLDVELPWRLGDLLQDEVGVEEDLLALDLLAGGTEQLDSLGLHELDAELADDAPPALVERGHRVRGEDLVAGHGVDEHGRSLSSPGERGPVGAPVARAAPWSRAAS